MTLVLFNPEETRGQVNYVVDGEVHTLQPGETHDLGEGDTWHIQFHRGDDFGNAEHFLPTGQYRFHVSKEDGWGLSPETFETK